MQSLILLGLAIFLGLLAVFGANVWLDKAATPSAAAAQTVKLVVARAPLAFGDTVTFEKVALVDWPAQMVPAGAVMSVDAITGNQARVALYPITPNEPVLLSKLSGADGRGGLAAVIAPDKRAATIRIDDVAGVGGFARPGDTVDVMVTRKISDDRQITDVLLQNVRIIALDQTPQKDGAEQPAVSKTATLEVDQFDAQKLALGQQAGSLSLVLRNIGDQQASLTRTASLSDLRYGGNATVPQTRQAAAPAPAPSARPPASTFTVPRRPAGTSVEVVRGVTASAYQVGPYVGF